MLRRMMMAQAASGGGSTDAYWSNVVSLLNFPGADGSTTFTDEKGKTWAANGNAQIDTSLGYNAGLLDGTGDYIESADNADYEFGSGDFCVEQIARMTATGGQYTPIEKRGTGFTVGDWAVFVTPSNSLAIYSYDVDTGGNAILESAASSIAAGTPFHWAWTRSGTTMRLFLNGTQVATKTTSATLGDAATPLLIGKDNVSGGRFWMNGHIRASRITKGVARYTANFTPPTAPFPNS